MGIRVEVLGPVRVLRDGAEIEVSRSQVRRVLALLALRPSGASVDELVEHVWAEKLPADPRASLRVALSRVRSVLGDDADQLVPTSVGYRLEVPTDVREFEAILDTASHSLDPGLRAAQLGDALALWRADAPITDIGEVPLLEGALAHLMQLRTRATDGLVDALYSNGDLQQVVNAAKPRLGEDPGNERLAMQCSRALAGLGQKAAALATLGDVRSYLRNELGLDPDPGLVELEQLILRDGVEISGNKGVGRAKTGLEHGNTGSERRVFVGRAAERAMLRAAIAGLYAIVGEPGSGKSALLRQAVESFETDGRRVLRAEATATPTRPMAPLVELLTQIATQLPADEHSESLRSFLSRMAPESIGAVPDTGSLSREGLLAHARIAIDEFVAQTGAVIVLEDAQWLDRASSEVLRQLVDAGTASIVVTSRQRVPGHARFLHEPERSDHHMLLLGPLNRDDIATLVAAELGGLPQEQTVARLTKQSGGNALFVTMLAELLGEGALSQDDLPTTVLVTIQRRIDVLSKRAQQTLKLGSVFTGAFSVAALAELQPTAELDIAEAIAEGLIVRSENSPTVKFAHALVADAAYQMLPEGVRLETHDEVGRILESHGAPAAEYAVHCGAAVSVEPTRAVRAHLQAANDFSRGFAWDIALAHAQQGLGHAADYQVNDPTLLCELQVLAGMALRAQGNREGDDLLLDGLSCASEHGQLDTSVRAIVALASHGRMGTENGVPILRALDRALEHPALTVNQRAELLAAGSTLLSVSPLQARGSEMFREAFDLLSKVDDPTVRLSVLLRTHLGFSHFEDLALRSQAIEALADIKSNGPDQQWEVAFLRFHQAMIHDQGEHARRHLDEMERLTPLTLIRRREFGMRFSQAAWARYQGDLDAAEMILAEAVAIGSQFFDDEWVLVTWAAFTCSIREAQGRVAELLSIGDAMLGADANDPIGHIIVAAGAAGAGDAERARLEIDWLMQDGFAVLRPDVSWSGAFSLLSGPVALLQDAKAASTLLEMIEPYAGLNLWNGACIHQSANAVIDTFRSVIQESS